LNSYSPLPRRIRTTIPPIILVRHGEAEHLVSDLTGGWSNTSLTELGHRQARAVAEYLEKLIGDQEVEVLSSDLLRAVQTAQPYSDLTGIPIETHRELREINNGVAAGKRKSEVEHLYIEPCEPILDWCPYPEAESWGSFYQRVSDFMNTVIKDHAKITIIFTHGGTLRHIVSWWLGLEPEHMTRVSFGVAPTGITVLTKSLFNEHIVDRLNDTSHLIGLGYWYPLPNFGLT
jgi:broad specificity phosphatase PhoE